MPAKHGAGLKVKMSRVQAVEMNYLRSACGVSRMDGISNESVYKHFLECVMWAKGRSVEWWKK